MILHKYQALGNDFLILDCINFQENTSLPQREDFVDIICKVSDRRRLGCDQFIVIQSSQTTDAKIIFYNSDGSRADSCGNGTVASGIYISKLLQKNNIIFEIESKIVKVQANGNKAMIQLPMPTILDFPYCSNVNKFLDIILPKFPNHVVKQYTQYIETISVGNPHCVLIGNYPQIKNHINDDNTLEESFSAIGKQIENLIHLFPDRTNVEFVCPLGNNAFNVFVWERGAGRTFACGTGACAAAIACVKNNLADNTKPIKIYMEGSYVYGNNKPLVITLTKESVSLTNYAFFEGRITVQIH